MSTQANCLFTAFLIVLWLVCAGASLIITAAMVKYAWEYLF